MADRKNFKGDKLKQIERQRASKERFLRTRMWFSTLNSMLFPDRVKIPENIGNNIFIGNNQLVTRNNLTAFIVIKEFSTQTPVAFMSKVLKHVKTRVEGINIDFVIKNSPMFIDTKESGVKSRELAWYNTIENPKAPARVKKRAARLLYSLEVARKGEKFFRSIVVIEIRTDNGAKLRQAVKETTEYLTSLEITHRVVKSKLNLLLQVILLMSNRSITHKKDVPYTVQSPVTLAELLPATQGTIDDDGVFLGINRYNRYPYHWNYKGSAGAKNIAVYGPSGSGKTHMGISWMLDFFALGDNQAICDLKGNEWKPFVNATGGVIVPMRIDSKRYINTFFLDKKEGEKDPVVYYADRFNMSVNLMKTIVDAPESLEGNVDTLLNKFLETLYMTTGVSKNNVNTWDKSREIFPLMLGEAFRKFSSKSVREAYGDLITIVQGRFDLFFDKNGSKSYMFLEEYDFEEIYQAKSLLFDFGLLESSGVKDEVVFKVRSLFMVIINNEYNRYKKSIGEWTIAYLEEAQLTEGINMNLMAHYAQEFSIRRAQNRVNVLFSNSVTAIKDHPAARPIIDNTNILVIGAVSDSSREYLIKEYSLEKHRETLVRLLEDPNYAHTFLIVNRMRADIPPALIKIYNPDEVSKGKLYKVVDIVESN